MESKLKQAKRANALVNSPDASDVRFVLDDDEEIFAHRAILQLGSEYFDTMFRSGMAESKADASSKDRVRIPMPAVERSTLLSVLECIYGAECKSVTSENSVAVLQLGAQYLVESLAEHCASAMPQFVEKSNADSIVMALLPYLQWPMTGTGLPALYRSCLNRVLDVLPSCMDEKQIQQLVGTLPLGVVRDLAFIVPHDSTKNFETLRVFVLSFLLPWHRKHGASEAKTVGDLISASEGQTRAWAETCSACVVSFPSDALRKGAPTPTSIVQQEALVSSIASRSWSLSLERTSIRRHNATLYYMPAAHHDWQHPLKLFIAARPVAESECKDAGHCDFGVFGISHTDSGVQIYWRALALGPVDRLMDSKSPWLHSSENVVRFALKLASDPVSEVCLLLAAHDSAQQLSLHDDYYCENAFVLSSDNFNVQHEADVLQRVTTMCQTCESKLKYENDGSKSILRCVRWRFVDPAAALAILSKCSKQVQIHAAAVIKANFTDNVLLNRPKRASATVIYRDYTLADYGKTLSVLQGNGHDAQALNNKWPSMWKK